MLPESDWLFQRTPAPPHEAEAEADETAAERRAIERTGGATTTLAEVINDGRRARGLRGNWRSASWDGRPPGWHPDDEWTPTDYETALQRRRDELLPAPPPAERLEPQPAEPCQLELGGARCGDRGGPVGASGCDGVRQDGAPEGRALGMDTGYATPPTTKHAVSSTCVPLAARRQRATGAVLAGRIWAPERAGAGWAPLAPAREHRVRRRCYQLRELLRPFCARSAEYGPNDDPWRVGRRRHGACGRIMAPATSHVDLVADEHERLHWQGAVACGDMWACPVCASRARAARADQIRHVTEAHGRHRAMMVTLTVRHARHHGCRSMREALGHAWRLLTSGAPWRRFRRAVGVEHVARALEVTHGPAGWHPHLHVLCLVHSGRWEAAGVHAYARTVDNPDDGHLCRELVAKVDGLPADEWLAARWARCVRRAMGVDHVPDSYHGVHLTPCTDAGYLSKLGLEMSDPGRKSGREGRRTPHQIAWDMVTYRRELDRDLWGDYIKGFRGARHMTGLGAMLRRYPMPVPARQRVVVIAVPRRVWQRIAPAWVATGDGERIPGPLAVLEAAEAGGAAEAARTLFQIDRAERPEKEESCRPRPTHPP